MNRLRFALLFATITLNAPSLANAGDSHSEQGLAPSELNQRRAPSGQDVASSLPKEPEPVPPVSNNSERKPPPLTEKNYVSVIEKLKNVYPSVFDPNNKSYKITFGNEKSKQVSKALFDTFDKYRVECNDDSKDYSKFQELLHANYDNKEKVLTIVLGETENSVILKGMLPNEPKTCLELFEASLPLLQNFFYHHSATEQQEGKPLQVLDGSFSEVYLRKYLAKIIEWLHTKRYHPHLEGNWAAELFHLQIKASNMKIRGVDAKQKSEGVEAEKLVYKILEWIRTKDGKLKEEPTHSGGEQVQNGNHPASSSPEEVVQYGVQSRGLAPSEVNQRRAPSGQDVASSLPKEPAIPPVSNNSEREPPRPVSAEAQAENDPVTEENYVSFLEALKKMYPSDDSGVFGPIILGDKESKKVSKTLFRTFIKYKVRCSVNDSVDLSKLEELLHANYDNEEKFLTIVLGETENSVILKGRLPEKPKTCLELLKSSLPLLENFFEHHSAQGGKALQVLYGSVSGDYLREYLAKIIEWLHTKRYHPHLEGNWAAELYQLQVKASIMKIRGVDARQILYRGQVFQDAEKLAYRILKWIRTKDGKPEDEPTHSGGEQVQNGNHPASSSPEEVVQYGVQSRVGNIVNGNTESPSIAQNLPNSNRNTAEPPRELVYYFIPLFNFNPTTEPANKVPHATTELAINVIEQLKNNVCLETGEYSEKRYEEHEITFGTSEGKTVSEALFSVFERYLPQTNDWGTPGPNDYSELRDLLGAKFEGNRMFLTLDPDNSINLTGEMSANEQPTTPKELWIAARPLLESFFVRHEGMKGEIHPVEGSEGTLRAYLEKIIGWIDSKEGYNPLKVKWTELYRLQAEAAVMKDLTKSLEMIKTIERIWKWITGKEPIRTENYAECSPPEESAHGGIPDDAAGRERSDNQQADVKAERRSRKKTGRRTKVSTEQNPNSNGYAANGCPTYEAEPITGYFDPNSDRHIRVESVCDGNVPESDTRNTHSRNVAPNGCPTYEAEPITGYFDPNSSRHIQSRNVAPNGCPTYEAEPITGYFDPNSSRHIQVESVSDGNVHGSDNGNAHPQNVAQNEYAADFINGPGPNVDPRYNSHLQSNDYAPPVHYGVSDTGNTHPQNVDTNDYASYLFYGGIEGSNTGLFDGYGNVPRTDTGNTHPGNLDPNSFFPYVLYGERSNTGHFDGVYYGDVPFYGEGSNSGHFDNVYYGNVPRTDTGNNREDSSTSIWRILEGPYF